MSQNQGQNRGGQGRGSQGQRGQGRGTQGQSGQGRGVQGSSGQGRGVQGQVSGIQGQGTQGGSQGGQGRGFQGVQVQGGGGAGQSGQGRGIQDLGGQTRGSSSGNRGSRPQGNQGRGSQGPISQGSRPAGTQGSGSQSCGPPSGNQGLRPPGNQGSGSQSRGPPTGTPGTQSSGNHGQSSQSSRPLGSQGIPIRSGRGPPPNQGSSTSASQSSPGRRPLAHSGTSSQAGPSSQGPPISMKEPSGGGRKRAGSDEKKKKMRASLGSNPGQQGFRASSGAAAKTHLLVVQGGVHPAFVGDFLGLLDFFQTKISLTFGADFWTIYGPNEYFRDHNYPDIKFENRIMANRFNVTHYQDGHRFRTLAPTEICQEVFKWLDLKADATNKNGAKSGDAIIVIFLAHGSWEGRAGGHSSVPKGIRLGHNDLLMDDFVIALRKIPRNVQVNVLSNACFSAIFAQNIAADQQPQRWIQVASQPFTEAFAAERSVSGRFRNSSFVAGLVRCLAGLGNNNLIDLETLQTELNKESQKNPNPASRSTVYTYSDAPLSTQVTLF